MTSAPRGYGHQTGKGRATRRPASVREVESVACPAGGWHRLTNDAAGRTYCAGCGESWAALDEAVRAS